MYSQNSRLFSQEEEISQLTGTFSDQQATNKDNAYNTQGERSEAGNCFSEYNDAPLTSQADESFSTRAETICEQNRQIRSYLEKNLKQIERKRITLSNKKNEVEEEIKKYKEIHKRQSQQSVDFQMSIEEMAEKYERELNQRGALKEKLQHTQMFVDYFVQHCSEIPKVAAELEKNKQDLSSGFERLSTDLKTKVEEKNKLKLLCHAQMQEETHRAQATRELLMNQRKFGVKKIQTLDIKSTQNLNKISSLKEEISLMMNKRTESNDLYNQLNLQNKLMKENIAKLHQEVNEINTSSSLSMQSLNLQINNEQNNNSNLEKKCEENDSFINTVSTKEKELINLYNQMNGAIKETMMKKEEKQKKVDENKDTKNTIYHEIKKFEEEIKEYDIFQKKNESLKIDIKRLEESIAEKENVLVQSQNVIKETSQKEDELKKVYDSIAYEIQQINSELDKSKTYHHEIDSKLKEDRLNNQHERDAKILRNKTLEKLNMDFVSKEKEITYDYEEAKKLNNTVKTDKIKITKLIEEYNEKKLEADKKLRLKEIELKEKCEAFERIIDSKNNTVNELEKSIMEARPVQEELVDLLARKEALKGSIQQQKENFFKEKENHERSFNSTMKEISGEIERYTSIMEGIIKTEEEVKEKLKKEIKKADVERMNHEADLKKLFQQIITLKKEEEVKRIQVVKLEKRLKTINKEIKVTRQDISDAISGNTKIPVKQKSIPNQMKAPYSKDLFKNNHQEPPEKKMALGSNTNDSKIVRQIETKQWVQSVLPEDEYEFSDV